MSNPLEPVPAIIALRLLVSFLGEKKQFAWWDTSFLDTTGRRFLENPFPRTAVHAALRSAADAARRAHDAAIGRVGTFHLFRLPVDREEALEIKLTRISGATMAALVSSKEESMIELGKLANGKVTATVGPTQVGLEKQIGTPSSISILAAHYLAAFNAGLRSYPYFAKDSNG